MKKAAAAAGAIEAHDALLYLQRKAELDDNPLRLQMKTVKHRYELDGEEKILELPGEGKSELNGEERIRELPGEGKRPKGIHKQESAQAKELETSR